MTTDCKCPSAPHSGHNQYNVDCEALRCLCLGHGGHTHLTADLLWHIWCDVLGAQQSPSHLSCVKLKKLLMLYDFLFCWNMGSQSCAIPYWQLSSGLNVAYWPIHLLHDWPLPFSQLSSVQWTVLCLCFVSVSGNLLLKKGNFNHHEASVSETTPAAIWGSL